MLRRPHTVWVALLLGSCLGCLHDQPTRVSGWMDKLRTLGPSGSDAIYLEYVLIERPLGSPAINRSVWGEIDEQIQPSEARSATNNNGFRIGAIAGILPSELEAMISNPQSAEGHRQRRTTVGVPGCVVLNGPMALSEFQVRLNDDSVPTTVKREQAQFSLEITPNILPDGKLQLKCVPQVEYFDKKYWNPLGAVGSGWGGQKPTEKYPALSFDATINAKELLVIGTFADKVNTLGNRAFIGVRGDQMVQRILILHAGKVKPDNYFSDANLNDPRRVVPIASQAGMGLNRGVFME